MNLEARINQFKNMAESDPDNELGHFSLGKAYMDAGRFAEAAGPLKRVLQLNPTYSKAYQLLGRAQLELDQREQAIATLRRGYEVAAERGDIMPRDEISLLLRELGESVPQTTAAASSAAAGPRAVAGAPTADAHPGGTGEFRCSRCGRPHGKMAQRPFKGALGEKVWATVCQDCWREWIGMGTKVINEMGLQLADPRAQTIYDDYMKEFLQIED